MNVDDGERVVAVESVGEFRADEADGTAGSVPPPPPDEEPESGTEDPGVESDG